MKPTYRSMMLGLALGVLGQIDAQARSEHDLCVIKAYEDSSEEHNEQVMIDRLSKCQLSDVNLLEIDIPADGAISYTPRKVFEITVGHGHSRLLELLLSSRSDGLYNSSEISKSIIVTLAASAGVSKAQLNLLDFAVKNQQEIDDSIVKIAISRCNASFITHARARGYFKPTTANLAEYRKLLDTRIKDYNQSDRRACDAQTSPMTECLNVKTCSSLMKSLKR